MTGSEDTVVGSSALSPSSPIKVAFVAPTLHRGGAERQMVMIARTLHGRGFSFRFLLLTERGDLAAEAEACGVPVHVLGIPRRLGVVATLRAVPALVRAIGSYRRLTRDVDVVDAWLPPAYSFAGLSRPIAPVPVLIAGRRSTLDVHQTRTWARRLAAKGSSGNIDAVVANSRAAADQAVAVEGLRPEQVQVVHNGVTGVVATPEERADHRARWGAAPDDVVVGLVGNFLPGKGQDLMLEAAARLRSEHLPLRFVLVGDGPRRAAFADAVVARGLAGMVVLEKPASDAQRLYCGFDVYVQGSESEGLPNAVLEAAAAGLPVVATDVGGTSEVIRDGIDGILIPKGDVAAMASAIRRLASDAVLRGRMGASAATRASAFSPEQLGEKTAVVYRRCLAMASPRRVRRTTGLR